VEGVKQLQRLCPDVQCVILDDAYQHRRIRCGFNILLTPYDRLYVNDYLLPRGLLRDLPSQSIRANVVVVTKCPKTMQPIERRIVSNALKLATYQQLFYSSIAYDNIAIAPKTLLVTGIANPTPLVEHVKSQCANVQLLTFPDHHSFSPKDIQRILDKAQYCDQILTTEKDYMRMQQTELIEQLGEKLKVIGMQTDLGTDQEAFNRAILLYVSENNRQQNK
jgi:tetraacyldisaccharide 4'-kinase